MLGPGILPSHMLEGLHSGQVKLLELEELIRDSVREEFKNIVEEGILSQEEADSHQEGTVRMRLANLPKTSAQSPARATTLTYQDPVGRQSPEDEAPATSQASAAPPSCSSLLPSLTYLPSLTEEHTEELPGGGASRSRCFQEQELPGAAASRSRSFQEQELPGAGASRSRS